MKRINILTDIEKNGVYLALPSSSEAAHYALQRCDYNISEFDPAVGKCINPISLLMCLNQNNKQEVIGNIVLFNKVVYKIPNDKIVYPWVCDQFEIGIRIFKAQNIGKGYGTTALIMACEYGKIAFNARFAVLKVLVTNNRAIRSYEKAGFNYWRNYTIDGYPMTYMYKEL